MATRTLTAHEYSKDRYGAGCAEAMLRLLHRLERAEPHSARALWRLHEVLCFLRAYPDDARVLAEVERMLARFSARADLRRAREALTDTGIAGTPIRYRFFWSTVRWLVRRWPDRIFSARMKSASAQKTWLLLTPNSAGGYPRSSIACGCAFHPRAIDDPRGRLFVRAKSQPG